VRGGTCGETGVGDPIERAGESVQGQNDDETGVYSRERSAYAGHRLDCRTRERPGCRIRIEECSDQVCYADGREFLPRDDLVIIDPAERFRDSDMFEEENDC